MSAKQLVPGPGNYNIGSKACEGPKYIMGLKPDQTKYKLNVPGPGTYKPDQK